MNHRLRVLLPSLVVLAAILACNIPLEQVPPPGEVQTAAALTVQAVIMTPSRATAESSSPVSETPSPTSSPGQSPTVTPTYSVPSLTIRESTNCRTGPGEAYEVVFTYLKGKKLEIVGRYDPGNFWLVKSNESPTGTCWLWGEYADVVGSYWAVSSVTPPSTSTSAPPRAPVIQEWNFSCDNGTLDFTVSWKDTTTGETGYRVFRNGKQIAELPANSTSYTDMFNVSDDLTQSVEYYIQVYSSAGSANTSVMRMKCGE